MGSEAGNWPMEEIHRSEEKNVNLRLPFLTALREERATQKMVTELMLGVRAGSSLFL